MFIFSTHPAEFAASLHRLGINYKVAYAVSLTLRYIPEIKKDFINILHAKQARGIDIAIICIFSALAIYKNIIDTQLFWHPF